MIRPDDKETRDEVLREVRRIKEALAESMGFNVPTNRGRREKKTVRRRPNRSSSAHSEERLEIGESTTVVIGCHL